MEIKENSSPQCQFYVLRKKRLCRMTIRPGRNYCGEHEPQPRTEEGQADSRIPCPLDPKHTCYASKLDKHLTICNARQGDTPPYIVYNINAPTDAEDVCPRKPLSKYTREELIQVIDKVNFLYEKYIEGKVTLAPEYSVHSAVLDEFSAGDRSERSRRHLRQASALLHIVEGQGLVQNHTCYVELGAGKGQLSYYAWCSWCAGHDSGRESSVVLIDRAALRHKRDNKVPVTEAGGCSRVRADLAHLALQLVPTVAAARALVGIAKHLCGVATDYALRCVTESGVVHKTRGVVLATCCHHRCERAAYVANTHLQELGVSVDDMNIMLGIVSWATCGDGRSRDQRKQNSNGDANKADQQLQCEVANKYKTDSGSKDLKTETDLNSNDNEQEMPKLVLAQEYRERVGRRAKAIFDWGRVLYLREKGFDAQLIHYVSSTVSPENMCIVAKQVNSL